MSIPSTRSTTGILATLTLLAGTLLFTPAWTGDAEAQGQVVAYRAGTQAFLVGTAGMVITFSAPMPTDDYAAVVQAGDTGGYSPTADCTYFNVLKKKTTHFEVQHKRCDDGTPVPLDIQVSLNWIAWSYN